MSTADSYKHPLFIVTGTSRGLGAAIRSQLQNEGIDHITLGRSEGETFVYDFTKPDSFEALEVALSKKVGEEHVRNDVLVLINNAAHLGELSRLGDFTSREIVKTGMLNFMAPVVLGNWLASLKRPFVIMNIISGAAYTHNEGLSLYSATKRGMIVFFEIAQKELEQSAYCLGIRQYDPGMVDTDMQVKLRQPSEYVKRYKDFQKVSKEGGLKESGAVASEIIQTVKEIVHYEKN